MSIGKRIKSARIMAGLSQRELAQRAGVSPMAISKYERDMDIPGSTVLLRLAQAVGVKIEYFFRSTVVTLSPPVHQRHASLPVNQEHNILEHVQEWLERYLDIENLLYRSFPSQRPLKQFIKTLDDIENVAYNLREQWQLGLDPIEDLLEICEDHGIKIGLLDGDPAFDALTLWANEDIPVIVLRKDMPGERQRFCLSHELGHLFLELSPAIDHEEAANRFARSLLVPPSAVEFELGKHRHAISLYELYILKHKYGLSMQAWLYRAQELNILPTDRAKHMLKQFHQHGWFQKEPGEALPSEEPQRFQRLVMHALSEDIISRARATELLGESIAKFIKGDVEWHGGLSFELCG